MRLLISDANILIDLVDGGLIDQLFSLPWRCQVPDMLFVDELEEQHGHLVGKGLELGELRETAVAEVERLAAMHPRPSRYDCFALALAKQEGCPLLTGDGDLRRAAKKEDVAAAGTVWLVEQMVVHGLISEGAAHDAYVQMRAGGSRLPWKEAHERLELLGKGEFELRDLFARIESR